MNLDLGSARHWARELQQRGAAGPGATCVDATMGNGGDTLALCEQVGLSGRVFGFDVQESALQNTRARLAAAGLLNRAQLFLAGHERLAEFVKAPVDLVVFNLGWLPGSSDKGITTRAETTLRALDAACGLLKKGGLITLCAYPGHDEGARELQAVLAWARSLDARSFQTLAKGYLNQPSAAPVLLCVQALRER